MDIFEKLPAVRSAIIALSITLGALGCKALLPENQAIDDALFAKLEQLQTDQVGLQQEVLNLTTDRELLRLDLDEAKRNGATVDELNRIEDQLDDKEREGIEINKRLEEISIGERKTVRDRELLRDQDRGEQVRGWGMMIASILGLVQVVGFGVTKNAAIKGMQSLPSRGAKGLDELGTKVGQLDGFIRALSEGFKAGAERPPGVPPSIPPPEQPFTYPPPVEKKKDLAGLMRRMREAQTPPPVATEDSEGMGISDILAAIRAKVEMPPVETESDRLSALTEADRLSALVVRFAKAGITIAQIESAFAPAQPAVYDSTDAETRVDPSNPTDPIT